MVRPSSHTLSTAYILLEPRLIYASLFPHTTHTSLSMFTLSLRSHKRQPRGSPISPLPCLANDNDRSNARGVRSAKAMKARRKVLYTILAFFAGWLSLFLLVVSFRTHQAPWRWHWRLFSTLPPLYPEYHRAEVALPQHDLNNPFAGGRKYIWVASHAHCKTGIPAAPTCPLTDAVFSASGWGNFMQDMIFNAQVVYETGRSYAPPHPPNYCCG